MEEKKHILVVEDDKNISNILRLQLERAGYKVTCARDGLEGVKMAKGETPDLILLDWMLPQIAGVEVCKVIKKKADVPIIFLTSKNRERDIIEGLEAGGDDYVTKPFKFEIVLARIRANLRKYGKTNVGTLQWKDIRLDTGSNNVFSGDERIILSKNELNLLRVLMENPRSVLSRNRIIHELWGYGEDEFTKGNNLDVMMNSLRKKLSPGDKKKYIATHRGIGYGLA